MPDIDAMSTQVQRLSQSVSFWNFWVIVGMIVAAVSAAFLVIAQWKVNRESQLLSEIQDKLIKAKDEKLAIELADKGLLIAQANDRAAMAVQRAAEANRIAEAERLARAKIEEKLAPRSITASQMKGLSERLKPYAGTSVDILQVGESPEITHFRSLIEAPLHSAGWHFISSTAVGSGALVGLSVGVVDDSDDAGKNAARLLLSALNEEGIFATNRGFVKRTDWPSLVMAPTGMAANRANIRIYVGSKS